MNLISGVSVVEDVSLVTINHLKWSSEILSEVFSSFAKANINVDMISQTAPQGGCINISFTIGDNDIISLIKITAKYKQHNPDINIDISSSNTKVIFFGEQLRDTIGAAAEIFSYFKETNTEIKIITTSETEISCLIERSSALALTKYVQEKLLIEIK